MENKLKIWGFDADNKYCGRGFKVPRRERTENGLRKMINFHRSHDPRSGFQSSISRYEFTVRIKLPLDSAVHGP